MTENIESNTSRATDPESKKDKLSIEGKNQYENESAKNLR